MLKQAGWRWAFVLFGLLFIVWTGVGVEQVVFAVAAAAVAAWVRSTLSEAEGPRARFGGLVRFVPYFVWVSVRGGVDVARRSVMPSMPIEPEFVDYELRIDPQGAEAVVFAAAISLVPGTLCVDIGEGDTALVHLIDSNAGFEQELQRLERRVAQIFGEPGW